MQESRSAFNFSFEEVSTSSSLRRDEEPMGPLPQIYPIIPHRMPDNIGMIQYKRFMLSALIVDLKTGLCRGKEYPSD
jgi:hypothetical protein